MILSTTDATDVPNVRNFVSYYFAAAGGNVALQRRLSDGTLVALANSPILDGEEVEITTVTANSTLVATATVTDTELTYGVLKTQ